jgi:hypothetical protein
VTCVFVIDRLWFGFLFFLLIFLGTVVTGTLLIVVVVIVLLLLEVGGLWVHEAIIQNVCELVKNVLLAVLAVLLPGWAGCLV